MARWRGWQGSRLRWQICTQAQSFLQAREPEASQQHCRPWMSAKASAGSLPFFLAE